MAAGSSSMPATTCSRAVVTTHRRLRVAIALIPLALVVGLILILTGGSSCNSGGDATPGSLSQQAKQAIPPDIAPIYLAEAKRWNIDVAFLASIGGQETDHGRNPRTNQVNSSGCQGLMQLGIGGQCGNFWGRNECDGNHDGRMVITDPWDNVCAAARGLRRDKGAPPAGGSEAGYHQAACNYYGACAGYADEVMARAKLYGFVGGTATDPAEIAAHIGQDPAGAPAACAAALPIAAGNGQIIVDPGANRPGVDLAPELVAFLRRMAEFLPKPPIVTTGSNHPRLTTTGNVSDHWDGHAVDLGSARNGFPASGGGYGDKIAEAAFLAAGESPAAAGANAARGGAYTIERGGLRIQILWKTLVGGNHYNHVHVGVRSANPAT
jgi:hypothetical protein